MYVCNGDMDLALEVLYKVNIKGYVALNAFNDFITTSDYELKEIVLDAEKFGQTQKSLL